MHSCMNLSLLRVGFRASRGYTIMLGSAGGSAGGALGVG